MKIKQLVTIFVTLSFLFSPLTAEELPIPTYSNSIIISIEHHILDSDEIDTIKNAFNFGLYAWLSFSHTHVDPILAWQSDWSDASNGIQSFKNIIDSYIAAAKSKNVKLHIVLCSGLARGLSIYKDAKLEDIRNGQWYNDNNLAAVDPTLNSNDFNITVFGTFSRYARKLRDNLEAKAKAALAFLKQKMDENPDTLIAISGWGEAEFNFHRINQRQHLQDYFCDYSPFAVLEFRDWIRHEGMYKNSSGLYEGQGYPGGGSKYQGSSGLIQFNSDFGTNFTTWELKYFNWSLTDPYDTNPKDTLNNDPGIIPYTSYSHGNMMSIAGTNVLEGGFDPLREMGYPTDHPGHSDFWDLWNLFRETMVHNLVKDMAKLADEAGIPADKWYSHQIPGDYLFGTNPQTEYKNSRYYSSASPLWTANNLPYGSMGATIYDIKYYDSYYGDWWARTSQFIVPDIAQLSQNWAAMEYDAEVYPDGLGIVPSSPEFIQEQYLRTYNYYCHLFNFFRWKHAPIHNIKGTNKEPALRLFIDSIRDKGRKQNLENRLAPPDFAFDPPKHLGISGQYSDQSGSIMSGVGIQIAIEPKIWSGHSWTWQDWGDFDHFEIYRSTIINFSPSVETFLASSQGYSYTDGTVTADRAYFYRVRAVNSKGAVGPFSDSQMMVASSADSPILYVDRTNLVFSANQTLERVAVSNLRPSSAHINWQAASDKSWILFNPPSGSGDGTLRVGVDAAGLYPGSYSGEITVSDSNSLNSPQLIQVTLKIDSLQSNPPPFGSFDTPIEGSTVSASVPVTGWALDNTGIQKVEIKRAPDPDDPPAAIGPDGLIYIGDAVFVKGSRPDIEALYSDYLNHDRSGWGYMLLTYGLPRLGNGSFTLYAFAEDLNGTRTLLGTKQITCDNNNRARPFGSIDTPGQGAVVSGNFVNFGWVLTPSPKKISVDGSTIWISMDGVYIANANYNHFRQDIYDSFPGYLNRDGAVGYLYIDTTKYSNGMHNIGWYAVDDNGDADGFGSRFFEINNAGGATAAAFIQEGIKFREDRSGLLKVSLVGPEKFEVEELDRIEIRLKSEGGQQFIGWGADETKSLPVGSTLDREKGVFYWSIGPGFLKSHTLHFAVTDGVFRSAPLKIQVNIKPKTFKRHNKETTKFLHKK